MRLDQKKQASMDLRKQISASTAIYLADFTGLSVKTQTVLRSRLREQGINYRVVKNTLVLRALEGLEYPDLGEYLRGPTALVMSETDPVGPARAVRDFAKENGNRPSIRAGVVDGALLDADQAVKMADMQSREELLGSIAGGLTSGVGGIVGVLNSLIGGLGDMIEQVAKQKADSAD